MAFRITDTTAWLSLTFTEFETVLAALEGDAPGKVREEAQDVLQLRAPRPWLQALEDAENARRATDA